MNRANIQSNKTTILGYHDKSENSYTLISDELPILLDETYAPFLITTDYHYTIKTKDLSTLINTYQKIEKFDKYKSLLAQALILPGLIVSVLFMFTTFRLLPEVSFITAIVGSKVASITFWLSILGVIVLWHEYYRNKSHPIKIPQSEDFDEKNLVEITTKGVEFEKYSMLKALYFLGQRSQQLLVDFTSNNGLDSMELFKTLVSHPDVIEMVTRSDLDLSLDQLDTYGINAESMPSYPLPALRSIMLYALNEAIISGADNIKPIHIFLSYMRVFPILKKYLKDKNSSHEILQQVAYYMFSKEKSIRSVNQFNVNFPYFKTGGIAREWIYGYTFFLNKFTKDLNQKMAFEQNKFGIGHDREVNELVSVVGRLSKNNALLIGEPGVGKSSIIKGLAQKINRGNVPPQLLNKRITQLDLNTLIAISGKDQNLEALVGKAMGELERAGNTILYIDEIQQIIPTQSQESGQNIAGILLPFIIDGKFPIVGSINYRDYKKAFYDNESLKNSFEPIEVSELTASDTMKIMQTKIELLEKNYGLYVTFPALTTAIELAQRYIVDRRLPDSAVNVIEAACAWAQASGIKKLTSAEVARSVAMQINIPVDDITVEEATNLMNLESNMTKQVIGQDEAVHSVVESLKRARTDIRDPNKPIGVFLFLGPTGTGKTHLSKVLAKEYFGSTEQFIRLDMSEYQEINSISKILGSNQEDARSSITLLDKIKQQPFSVILFDEIEKAHPQVLDLFLQLFDDGRLTNSFGETIDFTNSIIICTSNIGSRQIIDALERDGSMWEEAKQSALLELRGALRPELINRFDKLIMFAPHGIENLVQISKLLLDDLAIRLQNRGISIVWEESIPMLIANNAQEPGMGARPLRRFIQDRIEAKVADEILSTGLTAGDTVQIKESWLA